jgi:cytochrome c556
MYGRAMASILVGGLALGAGSLGAAEEPAKDPVKARHDLMEGVQDGLMAVAAIAKGEAAFDAAVVSENAGKIADNLTAASKLFPEGSEKGTIPSRAKAEVWSQRAGFDAGMKAAIAAATALKAVTDEAALKPALGALGASCKECHETYRTPEE